MSAFSIKVPFPVFQDRDGQPLDNGYVWLGEANLNPQTNPVVAYYDAALTIPAVQPLRTINGYVSNSGTPAQIYVDGVNFSILVQDSKGSMVYNFPDGTGISVNIDSSNVTYDPPFTASVPTTVELKLAQTVSVKDFGAVGDGVTDDLQAFNDAFSAAKTVYVPEGTYFVSNTLRVPLNKNIYGTGNGSIISGNFPSPVVQFNGPAQGGISDNIFGKNFKVLAGLLCTAGIRFDFVVRSMFEGLIVEAQAAMPVGYASFRVGAQVYTNSFTSCIADSKVADINSYGWHIGNAFNDGGSILAATNNNNFNICYSRRHKKGFFLDTCRGSNLYGCCSEGGTDWGVDLAGGQTNCVYNHWNENGKGFLFSTSQKQNGSGGTAPEAGQFNAVRDCPRFGINFEMQSGLWNQVENTIIQGTCTIDASCEYAMLRNLTEAGGSSIVDNGNSTHIELRYNSYRSYDFIYSTGPAQNQALKLTYAGNFLTLTNLYNNRYIQIPGVAQSGVVIGDTELKSSADNAHSLGTASRRWSEVFAGNGTINTSDAREKQEIENIGDAEKRVAIAIKGLIKKFKFKGAVESKGDGARIHVGVIAQDIASAFESEGLDPNRYGIFCYDEWEEIKEEVDEKGNVISPAQAAGNRYGVRYEELLAFVIAAL